MSRRRQPSAVIRVCVIILVFSCMSAATAAGAVATTVFPAVGLPTPRFESDAYRERYPDSVAGWRGICGRVYNYDWVLKPNGHHVSSLYMFHAPIDFYRDDGYFDTDGGFTLLHLEAGLTKDHGDRPFAFYQFCYDPTASYFPPSTLIGYLSSGTTWSGGFQIENTSMGSLAPEDWRIKYNGAVVAVFGDDTRDVKRRGPQFPMLVGEALTSAERWYVDVQYPPDGDDNRAAYNDLMRKNSVAAWRSWQDAAPAANGDPNYRYYKLNGSNDHLRHVRSD